MSESKVYCVTEWYVKCNKCKSHTEVEAYDSGVVICDHCGNEIIYDNGNSENICECEKPRLSLNNSSDSGLKNICLICVGWR